MLLRRILTTLKLSVLLLTGTILIGPEWPAFGDEFTQLNAIVGARKFDFLIWEFKAIGVKLEAILSGGHNYLERDSRKEVVLDYLALVGEANSLERQIQDLYSDPDISNPDESSQELQALLQDKRALIERLQPLAEAIVQDQVATVLAEEGFEIMGQAWPPVMMHMSPLPSILIVSPRDRIERLYGIPLVTGLDTPSREEMEHSTYKELDLSALVVNLGGLGTYPAMITETSNVNRLAEVTAHEWAHHWLAPYPITVNYLTDAQIRTMNETVASIVGTEIGAVVIARYYPEAVPPPRPVPPEDDEAPIGEPSPFDFRAEMAETRIGADELLAEGKIEEAEAYMEERRRFLFDNGYHFRKINQAFFAFRGAYADEPGEAGSDPIGPALLAIRAQSPSLLAFLQTMATVRDFEDLQTILGAGGG